MGHRALEAITPIRAATGEELGRLRQSHSELRDAVVAAGKELKDLAAKPLILNYLRKTLKKAMEVAREFEAIGRKEDSG
jgi:hypothetical protein